jgi:hypothetical protein
MGMLLHKEPRVKDWLPPISHVLWVHGQGLTSLEHNQYHTIMLIQASEHPTSGTKFGENCKTTKPSSGLSMLLGEEPHAMGGLPSVPYLLYVHGQGLTSLEHNQYTGVLFVQVSEHPTRCGIRFGENCKITMSSSVWIMLLHKEPHTMDILPLISRVIWVHVQGLNSLGHNQYTSILFIQASEHPSSGTRFGEKCKTIKPSL